MIKQITEKRLLNMALFYLSRYEASEQKLRQMLERRVKKQALNGATIPPEIDKWIQNTVQKAVSLGYVNNERYAEMRIRILCRQGKSTAYIRRKLSQDGIDAALVNQFLETENTDSDTVRALTWLKRQRKGGYRSAQNDSVFQKDLAALARQGFSYVVAKEALDESYRVNQKPIPDDETWD